MGTHERDVMARLKEQRESTDSRRAWESTTASKLPIRSVVDAHTTPIADRSQEIFLQSSLQNQEKDLTNLQKFSNVEKEEIELLRLADVRRTTEIAKQIQRNEAKAKEDFEKKIEIEKRAADESNRQAELKNQLEIARKEELAKIRNEESAKLAKKKDDEEQLRKEALKEVDILAMDPTLQKYMSLVQEKRGGVAEPVPTQASVSDREFGFGAGMTDNEIRYL